MRLLVPLLVMAGLLSVTMGLLVMVLKQEDTCAEFQCASFATVETAMAGVTWFSIAFILWVIAGLLTWMRRRFDQLSI